MSTIRSLRDLQEHLNYWDPPEDVHKVFRQFKSYEEQASFEKWEGQQVFRCNDGGLDAAVETVLQKLGLRTDIKRNVWRMSGISTLRNSSEAAYIIPLKNSSGATVSEVPLVFGRVTYVNKNVQVKGHLDCLVILL